MAGAVAQHEMLAALASLMGPRSNANGCTSNPVPCSWAWRNNRRWADCLGSFTHMGDLNEAPGFYWAQPWLLRPLGS